MKSPAFLLVAALGSLSVPLHAADEAGWITLFDGSSLRGWHVSTKTGHSGASGHRSGGKWEIVDGAITGSQDIPGNGGILITDEQFGDFEVKLEMRNDFGPDSGLFLRSTEDGKAWQAMIDYHADGNLMGIYGEGLGGRPHVRNYNFTDKVTEIVPVKTGEPPVELPVLPEAWSHFWRADQWNELRARIVGNPPQITTWINGVKIMEWQEKEIRHPETGGIALQVHGGGDFTKQFVRYRNVKVKKLGRESAATDGAGASRRVLAVLRDGAVEIDGQRRNGAALAEGLKDLATQDPKAPVLVRFDKTTAIKNITAVVEACRLAGIDNVQFEPLTLESARQ